MVRRPFKSTWEDKANLGFENKTSFSRSEGFTSRQWLDDHWDRRDHVKGKWEGSASNPRDPEGTPQSPTPRYPQPYTLTRPPTGPITRGKTNKGSYYTLLLKDTRADGEGTLDTTGTKEQ